MPIRFDDQNIYSLSELEELPRPFVFQDEHEHVRQDFHCRDEGG